MENSASPTISSTGISEQQASRPIACLRCRHRRSYCSKDKPQCSRCRESSLECTYEDARKIVVNESYLRELEAKVKLYEDMLREAATSLPRTRLTTADINAQISYSGGDNEDDFDDEHVLLGPFTQLSIDRTSTSFKGPGSSDNFLRNVGKLSGIRSDDWTLDQNPNFYEPGALPSRRHLYVNRVRLPPIQVARRLFQAQYTYIGTIFAFTDPTAFDEELAAAYRGLPHVSDKEACLAFAKVLVILAFGQLYSVNQWIGFEGPPGFDYFTHALQLLPEAHEEGSILCVETLALIGYFMQNMNRRDAAFLYIGMAMRMAISLGLHQEVSTSSTTSTTTSQNPSPVLDSAGREHRRRVWWSVYSLDRILSVKSGNPVTIQDEDIGVELPSRLSHEADYCAAVVLRHYTELSRILGEVSRSIYRKAKRLGQVKSGKRLMEAVQNIVLSLSRWNAALPQELRFDPARLSITRESVSTFSHYYQCINMTARPLLFHVVQKRLAVVRSDPAQKEREWRSGLSPTTVRVIEMCISAAQDTINMMSVAAQRDLVATYGYMDGEHIFSATIVLIMVCIAFPTHTANTTAMDAGLELLRSMAQRGNSHMGTRYELLVHLRTVLMPAFDPDSSEMVIIPTGHAPSSQPPSFGTQPQMPGPAVTEYDDKSDPGDEDGNALGLNSEKISASNIRDLTSGDGAGKEIESFTFPMVDTSQLDQAFPDENMTDVDFVLWEAGFANPTVDVGYDLTDLTYWAYAAPEGFDGGMEFGEAEA